MANKNHYTLTIFSFFLLFLGSIFFISKRNLEPSHAVYRKFFSKDYSHIDSSPQSIIRNSTDESVQGNTTKDQNFAPVSRPKQTKSNVSYSNVHNEVSVEDKKIPVAENESSVDNDGGLKLERENTNIENEISVEGKKIPVAENEAMVDSNGGLSFARERMCDLYMGTWVKNEGYPIYRPGSCPYVDEAFDCQMNGRGDSLYLKWRWKPDGCDLPRFNATDFLERLRGKRLMLVGDSMNRNQFESLLCLLREGLTDKSTMYEIHGHKITKGRGYYVFKFLDYNCSVEFVRSHFLVKEGTRINGQGNSNPTLSIDQIDKTANKWKRADILVFNTGHWWVHGKTSRGKNYFKEGDYLYPKFDSVEAYRRALKTWGKWIDDNIKQSKQLVFYRGYSSAHFRGGDWDSGGSCSGETKPILKGGFLNSYPPKMKIVEEVIQEMHNPVILLNITRLTNFRKDGHPSIYGQNVTDGRKISRRRQDCSHWCLPGIPDAWNELLYATLVFKQTATGIIKI